MVEAICERIPPGFRHARPERWHVTLSFHPDASGRRLEDFEAQLTEAFAQAAPFELRLEGTGRFGPISWLGLSGEVEVLHELSALARRAARVARIPTDAKPYQPHLTLGRDEGALADAMWGWRSEPWRVEEVRLMHSLVEGRTRHDVIGTFSLPD